LSTQTGLRRERHWQTGMRDGGEYLNHICIFDTDTTSLVEQSPT
jgi:hypothetical protein